MFVVKNAWKSVTRNKGRNMLIIVIVTIIAAAATIGLSIRQAAATARSSGLDNTTVTAQISLDRGKLISESREQSKSDSDSSDASAKPDFDAMHSALADKQFSLADYQKYAKASSAVKSIIIWRPRGWRRPTISSRSPIRPMLPPNLTSTPCVPLWPTSSFRLPTIRSTRRLHPR